MIESPSVFEVGRTYRRVEIHERYGGQRYGGISTPAGQPWVLLISGEEGAAFGYDDEQLEDGTLLYFGEGQVGPMTFSHGNLAIRDHAENGEDLFLFRKVRDAYIRFAGQYVYGGHEIRPNVRDRNGNPRDAIVFRLIPHGQLVADARSNSDDPGDGLDATDLPGLRAAAIQTPKGDLSPTEARRVVWRRSRAVRRYVLGRARGRCEGCGESAPFLGTGGAPYLEPHHTRRLTDSGPDHPAHVIALCPTCHSRVHYGIDGDTYNQSLIAKLVALEGT